MRISFCSTVIPFPNDVSWETKFFELPYDRSNLIFSKWCCRIVGLTLILYFHIKSHYCNTYNNTLIDMSLKSLLMDIELNPCVKHIGVVFNLSIAGSPITKLFN